MSNVGLSTLLLAVVAMLISIMIGGLVIEVSDDISSALSDSSETLNDKISTDFDIVSPSELDLSNDILTIHIKNDGLTDISIGRTTIILDGQVIADTYITKSVVEGSTNVWDESETLTINVDVGSSSVDTSDLCNSENTVKVTANQNSDKLEFFANC